MVRVFHAAAGPSTTMPEHATPAPSTILVADDTPDAAEVIARMLETVGYAALCAHSAREALDLVVADYESSSVHVLLLRDGGPAADQVDLVFHESNQRRYDDGNAFADHGGQLVAKAFAPARWHDHERIFSV